MKKTLTALAFIAATTLIIQCSKKHDAGPSRMVLLTRSAGWVTVSIKDGKDETIDDCEKDDVIKFLSGGTYSVDIGVLTCSADDENSTSDWAFNSAQTTLTFDKGTDDETTWTILELTSLILRLQIIDGNHTGLVTLNAK